MSSNKSLENSKLREELKKLRGALKDLQDDKLIQSPTHCKPSESLKQVDKLDSLRSEDIENLCKFEKILDSTQQDLSENSLKLSSRIENIQEKLSFKSSKISSNAKNFKEDPLYDHLLDSSLKFSIDSQSAYYEENLFKYSESGFDRIKSTKLEKSNEGLKKDFGNEENDLEGENRKNSQWDKAGKSFQGLEEARAKDRNERNEKNERIFRTENKDKISFAHEFDFPMATEEASEGFSGKVKAGDQQNLLDEIEKLRKENCALREQLKSAQSMKIFKEPKIVNVPFRNISPKRCKPDLEHKSGSRTPKKVSVGRITVRTNRTRSVSRSKSKSLTPRDTSYKITNSPLTPKRYRHCNVCDHLLSKGYSTKYCSKHGISGGKQG